MLVTGGVAAWLSTSPFAAEKPNFSGRWIGAGSSVSFTIEQDDSTVTITYPPGVAEGRRLVSSVEQRREKCARAGRPGQRQRHRPFIRFHHDLESQEPAALPLRIDDRRDVRQRIGATSQCD
jgi:hypothetical protein